jgi:hypothetical protein
MIPIYILFSWSPVLKNFPSSIPLWTRRYGKDKARILAHPRLCHQPRAHSQSLRISVAARHSNGRSPSSPHHACLPTSGEAFPRQRQGTLKEWLHRMVVQMFRPKFKDHTPTTMHCQAGSKRWALTRPISHHQSLCSNQVCGMDVFLQ